MTSSAITAFVHTTRFEAQRIISFDLRSVDGSELPEFGPGAHIDLHLPGGVSRSYSIVSDPKERHHYVVSVLNAPDSRGGSKYVHEYLRAGTEVTISSPRNNFQLRETSGKSILIAGGIGITPIYSMFRHLQSTARPVEMLYCARSRRHAAFWEELSRYDKNVILNFNDEHNRVSLRDYLAKHSADMNFYCCGPSSMLSSFEAACIELGFQNWYTERFAAANLQTTQNHEYEVVLRKSGVSVQVDAGHSLLESLLSAGIECDYACKEGICGACETTVLEGDPDHRDNVLTEAEKAKGSRMMICVSGAKGRTLVLDL